MFRDVGKKIKSIAMINFVILVILSIIISIAAGILLMKLFSLMNMGALAWLIAIVCFSVAFLFSWILYLLLCGYGEIVDSTSKTADYMAFVVDQLKKGVTIPSNPISSNVSAPVAGAAAVNSVSQRTETNYARPRLAINSSNVSSFNGTPAKGGWICEVCGCSNESSSSYCHNCKRPKY